MEVRRTPVGLAWFAAIAVLAMATPMAFVPSAEKELAALYPPLLRGDLSACDAKSGEPTHTTAVNLSKFTGRLHGSWELRTRTVHGITVSSGDRMARLYFDVQPASTGAPGSALLVDRAAGVPFATRVVRGESVAAFWRVGVEREGARRVSLKMNGESLGGYTHVQVPDISDARFIQVKDVFVAVDKETPLSAAWDKIVLTDKSMTYVSCAHGVVERYTKLSSQRPFIEGKTLAASWETLKGSASVAMRAPLAPSFVVRGR